MPKIGLHLHIEDTLEPDLMRSPAQRNGLDDMRHHTLARLLKAGLAVTVHSNDLA